jgi:multicomponent Na+:H+ antiporter subunit E
VTVASALRAAPGRVVAFVRLAVWYAGQLVVASVVVAREVLRPRLTIESAIVRVPVRVDRPGVVAVLATMINLTPGTVVIDVDPEHRHLYVHGFDVDHPDSLRDQVQALENRILRVVEG